MDVDEITKKIEEIEASLMEETPRITLGEWRIKMLEKAKGVFTNDDWDTAKLTIDLMFLDQILRSTKEKDDEKLKKIDPVEFVIASFLTPFKTGEERTEDKILLDLDYEKIKNLYGFTQEEIFETLKDFKNSENRFTDYVVRLTLFVEDWIKTGGDLSRVVENAGEN